MGHRTRTRPDRDLLQQQFVARFPVLVGVDAAKQKHTFAVRGPDGVVGPSEDVPLTRLTLDAWRAALHARVPGVRAEQILIGIEFAGGLGATLTHYFRQHGYTVVAVPAKAAKQTREGSLSGRNKTDRVDARHICTTLARGLYVRYPALRSPIAELKVLTMSYHKLSVERARLKNRLRGLLDLVWPELPRQANPKKATLPALVTRWPLPQDLLASSPRTVQEYVRTISGGKHQAAWIRRLLREARASLGLTDALPERRLELQHLMARHELLDGQLGELAERIEALVEQCPEARLLDTVPELGPIGAATIVAELGDPAAFEHPDQWLKLAGLHLAQHQTGQTDGRKRIAKQGRPLLRRQLYLLAGRWSLKRGLYADDHRALRAKGFAKTKAVCTLARRLVPVLFAIVRTGEPFDRDRFVANRRRREEAPMPTSATPKRARRAGVKVAASARRVKQIGAKATK